MNLDGTANVVGALAQAVADQSADALTAVDAHPAGIGAASGYSASAAAALSALLHFLNRPSVDLLRRVLGLTSSGTVRLLDRLEQDGLIERGPGPDGRTTAVTLTERGRQVAVDVSHARTAVLQRALAVLSPPERETFGRLAGQVLVGMMREPGAVRWMCRLCQVDVCRGAPGGCPVGNAARARYG